MTRERDIERLLDTWFRDGPTEAPDRIVDVVADRIGRQSQRPTWRLDWRHPRMTTTFKLASALAAIAIVAIVGWRFLPGSSDSSSVGGPGAAPSATPMPSRSAGPSPTPIVCEDDLPGCAGMLTGASHRSTNLVPPLEFEMSGGSWANVIDLPDLYKIDAMSERTAGHPYIIVWTNASIADQAVACSTNPDPTLGRAAADWIEFATTHPGIVVTDAVSFSMSGRPAQQFELSVAADWTQTCPDHAGPYVTLLTQRVAGQVAEYGVPADGRLLLTVVDIGERTVVIQSYGPADAAAFDRVMEPIRSLIDSFVMCGPGIGYGPCSGPGAPPPASGAGDS